VIGNSSSGITETSFLGVPTINVGDRQKGRHQCKNIIQTGTSLKEIEAAIAKIGTPFYVSEVDKMYWGDGHAAKKMLKILETEIG
jgi:UDP-N-acetylglucosamine 2-epimerase